MSKSKSINKLHLSPYVGLFLTGKDLDPQKITDDLGINPHKSFKRGDKRQSDGNERSHGLWMISSDKQINSLDLTSHLKWLLDQLELAKKEVTEISKDETINAVVSCFWIMPSSHEALIIDSELIKRLALLNIRLELSIFSSDY